MNSSRPPEPAPTALEKHLRVLQNAPAPDLTRGRARVLAQVERRRAHVARLPGRATFATSLGVGFAVMLLMLAFTMISFPQVTTAAITRTDTLQGQTFSPAALPGSALTPDLHQTAYTSAVQTPAPDVVPEPPRAPLLTNTRANSNSDN